MTRKRIGGLLFAVGVLLAAPTAGAQGPECTSDDLAVPSECFPDVLCPQFASYWDFRRAVVHISGPDIGGTGVLVNNIHCTNPGGDSDCGIPYVLTAAHIASDWIEPELDDNEVYALEQETTFTLGFESAFCGSPQYTYQIPVGGAQVVAWSAEKDLLLLRLNASLPAEAGPYFVGWGFSSLEQAVIISHPCGGPKKIAVSDPWMIEFQEIIGRDIFNVVSWEEGEVIGASSGGPLLESDTGTLMGIFTDGGTYSCDDPHKDSDARFTALTTIVPFMPQVANGSNYYDAYDPNAYLPLNDVETNSEQYGPGEIVEIAAKYQVFLADAFSADPGSIIHIHVPPGP